MKATEGNQMKIIEALKEINRVVWDKKRHTKEEVEAHRLATEAMTAPPRNCDVGTAEEQTKRLRNNCNKYKPSCIGCKYATDLQKVNCWLAWAQMPYEAKEGAEG